MPTYDWPAILKPMSFGFSHQNMDRSGGVSLAGTEQVVVSAGPSWVAAGTWAITNNDQVRAVRQLRSQLRGRANPLRLPNFDGQRLSWPERNFHGPTGELLTPGNTRRKQLDGTIFQDPEIPDASEIVATVESDAALQVTSIQIRIKHGGLLIAGQQFGIGDRLYEISGITVWTSIGGETVTLFNFMPPLRAAVTAGTAVKMTRPVCLMRCLNLDSAMRQLDLLRFATLSLEFAESFG